MALLSGSVLPASRSRAEQIRKIVRREETLLHHLQGRVREGAEVLRAALVPGHDLFLRPGDVGPCEGYALTTESDRRVSRVPAGVGGCRYIDEWMPDAGEGVPVTIGLRQKDGIPA